MSETSYDAVAYPCHPFPQTHPDRLAAIARLRGLPAAPVERCRVLELGGGDGGNLIPMALAYPDARFLGLDLAASSVERGKAWLGELGLANIELRAANVMEFPADAGEFDFILAHGLFSWVPAPVRDKILAICRDHLSADGIAYISYNALPGCHIRHIFRDMMRFHVRHLEEPAQRIEQAHSLMRFLTAARAGDTDEYTMLLKHEYKQLNDRDGSVLYHDDLAEINQPFFFHEFMGQATAHGLQYLAEADIVEMADSPYPPEVRALLDQMEQTDPLLREQYLDFLKCRRFRQTLLVRNNVRVHRRFDAEQLPKLWLSTRLQPMSTAPNLDKGAKESFRLPNGGKISIDHPLVKSALLYLIEMSPLPVSYADLLAAALARPGMPDVDKDDAAVLEILHQAFVAGLIEAHGSAPRFVRHPGAKPTTSPLARLQLRQGSDLVTSYRHCIIRVEPGLSRELILRLDGSRDRGALLADLTDWALANPPPGEAPMEPGALRQLMVDRLEPGLESVGAMGLLLQ